jgi:large subunit ribosomal protein L4
MAAILKALKLDGVSTLVTTAALDQNVYRSARNIDKVTVSPVGELNALAVLTPRKMLVTRAALDAIKERAIKAATTGRGAAE